VITLSMRRSFPAGVHHAGASRTCHPGRYAALPSPDPIHNFRSYLLLLSMRSVRSSQVRSAEILFSAVCSGAWGLVV
jgi:hypothetical protein